MDNFVVWLGLVFDTSKSACTTSVSIATFPRFSGDELTESHYFDLWPSGLQMRNVVHMMKQQF